jgi:hypothetical protein
MAQSSKLMRPDDVGLGGFDSHTLPPAGVALRAVLRVAKSVVLLLVFLSSRAIAQKPDSVGIKASATDTVKGPQGPLRAPSPFSGPPISPRRAFVYSALIPGLGQSALGRNYTGGTFFLIEAVSWAILRRSASDVRIAKAFIGDSVPQTYALDPSTGLVQRDGRGNPVVATWAQTGYSQSLVRARTLQVEDWVAVILFNHLVAGADAYVAANLWDLPQHLGVRATPLPRGGAALNFTLSFR